MVRKHWLQCLLAMVVCAVATPQAWSEEVDAENITVEEVLRRIDQNQKELDRLRAQLAEQQEAIGSARIIDTGLSTEKVDVYERLASLERLISDEKEKKDEGVDVHGQKFSVKVGGRIMYDITYGGDDGLGDLGIDSFQNGQEFRRVRLFAEGKGYGIFDYKVQVDFAGFQNPVAKDVYMGAHFPIGKFRIGHFKEPFSLEELTSSKYISFMERALPNAMTPSRSMGAMLFDNFGDNDRGIWQIGTFFDDLQQTAAENDGNVDNRDQEFRSINLRLAYLLHEDEFASERYFVHGGFGYRHVEVENGGTGNIRWRARPEIHDTHRMLGVRFPAGTDTYDQYGFEGAAVWGSASVQGEYILTQSQAPSDPLLSGGYIYASYFLTGENRPYSKKDGTFGRVKPLENFWWVDSGNANCNHGSGAWEVLARYSWLDYSDGGLTTAGGGTNGILGELENFTLGVNWYWTPYMRVMFNYVHSNLDPNVGDDADIDAILTRFQIDF